MTMLFHDGFDAQDVTTEWDSTLGAAPVFATGRYGFGSSFRAGSSSGRVSKGITPSAQVILGFNLNVSSFPAVAIASFWGDSGATQHHLLQLSATGQLIAQRATTVLQSTAAGVIATGTDYYIEMRGTIADSGGIFEVKVNGATVLNFTGDTKNAGTSTNIDMIALGGATQTNAAFTYDDLYCLNALGSANNTYRGECVAYLALPGGAGAHSDFTPTGSANNWENVDEVPFSTTDYNTGAAVGDKDSYAMGNVPAGTATIHSVKTKMVASKTGVGARDLRTFVRSGGTDYADATATLSGTPDVYSSIRETDPATSAAWTASGVNALEAGAEVV